MFAYTISFLEIIKIKIGKITHNTVVITCPEDSDNVGSNILLIEKEKEKSSNFVHMFL